MSYFEQLQKRSREELINDLYNLRVGRHADYDRDDVDKHGHGKRIPYIGWFWRDIDFVNKQISIGHCLGCEAGQMVGIMENNKWEYPERMMTEQEVDMFIAHLETAFACSEQSDAEVEFDKLWDWFQTLKVELLP